jgi:hypothetical protein
LATSFLSLSALAQMGIPVQWKPKGKSARFPRRRWYRTANSALARVNAWPKCKTPFMYLGIKKEKDVGGEEAGNSAKVF